MAVDSTPERSLSDLFNSSRAAWATTGWTPAPAKMGRHHHKRSVVSTDALGSERNAATPANVLSASA